MRASSALPFAFLSASLLALLASTAALADEPPAVAAAPEVAPPGQVVMTPEASVAAARAPRFYLGSWLLNAHLDVGAEPHPKFVCSDAGSATCSVISFGVGGQLLWRGTLGFGLGLYASEGSPLVPGSADQLALGDRISVPVSLAVRPLGWRLLSAGDSWLNRLGAGLGFELGPSVEYMRSSSATLPAPCEIPAVTTKVAFHGAVNLDIPLLGDTRSGWLSLRTSARLIVGSDGNLAPAQGQADPVCKAQVHVPGTAAQLFAGFAYYL